MSIISDIKSIFGSSAENNDYTLFSYPYLVDDIELNIYGVLTQDIEQENTVATKPLEQGNFTSDSQQIKPYKIMIRGVLLPDERTDIQSYQEITEFITWELNQLRKYQNGTQLFILANLFSNGVWEPLKLTSIKQISNTDMPYPEFIFMFQQIQTTAAAIYTTEQVNPPNVAEAQNMNNVEVGN